MQVTEELKQALHDAVIKAAEELGPDVVIKALCPSSLRAQADARPVAWVPIHPRQGPLWANTVTSLDADRPSSYEIRPVFFHPTEASAPVYDKSVVKRLAEQMGLIEASAPGLSEADVNLIRTALHEYQYNCLKADSKKAVSAENRKLLQGWARHAEELRRTLTRASAATVGEASDSVPDMRDSLYLALVVAEDQLRRISKLLYGDHVFVDKGRTVEIFADMAKDALNGYHQQGEHCMCVACKDGVIHASDCAVHNAPAFPNGSCDCEAAQQRSEPVKVYPQGVMGIPPYDPRATGSHQATPGLTWNAQQAEPGADEHDDFFNGVCVALSCVRAQDCGTLWREIVRTVGEDDLLQYAAHVDPDEWELAGFAHYARIELGKGKPRKLARQELGIVKRKIRAIGRRAKPEHGEG